MMSLCSRLTASQCGRTAWNIAVGTRNACTITTKTVRVFKAKQSLVYGKQALNQWTASNGGAVRKAVYISLPRLISLFVGRIRHKNVVCSIALFPLSFKFFSRKGKDDTSSPITHSIDEISAETLAAIPKEVFKKDKLRGLKRQGNILYRAFFAVWDQVSLVFRFLRIVGTFGPIFMMYPLTFVSDSMRTRWLRLLLYTTENSGPTFVKLGQWASSRRDLFKDDLCDLFIKLHGHTHRHSWYMTRRKLAKAFGSHWKDLFVTFERKPIGSGCIAQVHRAYMKASMIPDDSIVQEMNSLDDDLDDPYIDFAEGLEVIGLTHVRDSIEDLIDDSNKQTNTDSTKTNPRQQATSPTTASSQPYKAVSLSPDASIFDGDDGDSSESGTNPQARLDELERDPNYENQAPSEPASLAAEENPDVIAVAVKVLHPGIYRQVTCDLKILRALARVMEVCVPSLRWLSLTECMDEFTDLLTKQIDLRFESECLEQFVKNFEHNPNIRFPRPIYPYCKRDILVETYEQGDSIVKYLASDSGEGTDNDNDNSSIPVGLKEKLAIFGVDALLQMLFVHNFVHGDLHPGNILVQNADYFNPQGETMMMVDLGDTMIVTVRPTEQPVRLVLLDTGIVSTLSDVDLANLKAVFTSVITGDGDKVGELMLKHAKYNECQDIRGFKQDLADIVKHFREETIRLGKVQVGDLLSQVFHVCCRHKVKMESNFASIVLAVFVLEGIGRSLDPELDILERAKPILLG